LFLFGKGIDIPSRETPPQPADGTTELCLTWSFFLFRDGFPQCWVHDFHSMGILRSIMQERGSIGFDFAGFLGLSGRNGLKAAPGNANGE